MERTASKSNAYAKASRDYLNTTVKTASREELIIMVFDAAIRFAEGARAAIERKDFEEKHRLVLRVQDIMIELAQVLDQNIGEPTYSALMSLYQFVSSVMVEANIKNDVSKTDEALQILRRMRETWTEAIAKNREEMVEKSTSKASEGVSVVG